MYCIQSLMLSSETAGTPSGKRIACSFSFVPAEISVTVPLMRMLEVLGTETSGAETETLVGPLPKQ